MVERSYRLGRRSGAYKVVATLEANATTYRDTQVIPAAFYTYRVKAVQDELSSAYSEEASLRPVKDFVGNSLKKLLADMIVYPNPAEGAFIIRADNELTGTFVFRIIDLRGRTQRQYRMEKTDHTAALQGQVHGLKPGIYLLEVSYQGMQVQQRLQVK